MLVNIILYRFVNLLSHNQNIESTWTHVKAVRKQYYKKSKILSSSKSMTDCREFVSDKYLKTNYKIFSKLLNITKITYDTINLTKDAIKIGGEMFIYLNSCPTYWVYFYHHLFYGSDTFKSTIPNIIQTTLQVIKNSDYYKANELGNNLLAKFAKIIRFEYNQPLTNDIKNKRVTWLRHNNNVKGDITSS